MKRLSIIIFLLLITGNIFSVRCSRYLKNVRYYSYPDYTRVVVDLSHPAKVTEKLLPGKGNTRLYFDISSCRLHNTFPKKNNREINIQSESLKRIRIGRRNRQTIRVVFDFTEIGRYRKFYLRSPDRIVFDVFTTAKNSTAASVGKPADPVDGSFSVARQLGLGVHHIVIDPGHGGKDPGALNTSLGIKEKQITLDIARRLKARLMENTDYKITLTRETDKYVTLEERTAMANAGKADLFISIHLNSAPRKKARGIETYYLSFTTDSWASRVAAQENAVSTKTIGELKDIIGKIMQNSKLKESKVLAGYIQKRMVRSLKHKYNGIMDLGVKKAPFYVLAGSEMPAVLAEVSFLSHRQEGKRLKNTNYRGKICDGLYNGIMAYIHSLGKEETFASAKTSSKAGQKK